MYIYLTVLLILWLKASLKTPQMLVVSELDDLFLPIPDDLLVNLADSRKVVDAFLDALPSMFVNTRDVDTAMGPALMAAFKVMSNIGGKMLVFQCRSIRIFCFFLRSS
jgi:protein transport protein SEC24